MISFETPRLQISPAQVAEAPQLLEVLGYTGLSTDRYQDELDFWSRRIRNTSGYSHISAIRQRQAGMIGCLMLFPDSRYAITQNMSEVTYAVAPAPQYRRKGIASEALGGLVELLNRGELSHTTTMRAYIDPANSASLSTAKRAGFVVESLGISSHVLRYPDFPTKQ